MTVDEIQDEDEPNQISDLTSAKKSAGRFSCSSFDGGDESYRDS